ncbi:MAG: DUF2085 domain-containing protein [Candidatus Methanomethylophilaceae archaeon]
MLAILIIAPFTESYGTFVNLDGHVGLIDHMEYWKSVNLLAGVTYWFGDLMCHQQFSRSLVLNGSQMAICGRDLSALIGLIAGLVATCFIHPFEERKRVSIFFISGAFTLLITDWSIQYYMGLNVMFTRLITGFLAGFAVAMLVDLGLIRLNEK